MRMGSWACTSHAGEPVGSGASWALLWGPSCVDWETGGPEPLPGTAEDDQGASSGLSQSLVLSRQAFL